MEQLYAEAGCKKNRTAVDILKIVGMIFAGFVSVGLILFSGQFLLQIIGILGIAGIIYYYPKLNYEYEYIFCDGQIDFDKISGGNKRKTILKIDMDEVEICGPVREAQLEQYKNLKTKDFSSKQENGNTYAVIVRVNNEKIRILFDPSQKMVDFMRMKSPRKVVKYS